MIITDFWWLSPEETREYRYLDLFHQEPYSDEPNTNRDPISCPMMPSERKQALGLISQWKTQFKNINVFRSFTIYRSESDAEEIIGPFLIDIDRTLKGSYIPDLRKALEDTRLLVKEYCFNLKDKDYRVFFTGHKGFHIEIHPRAIDIPPNVDRRQQFEIRRKEINKQFGNAFIDVFHSHIRLHDSINSWIDYSGQQIYSMNFRVSIDLLFSLNVEDISAKAANLASEMLKS